jgi:hypothetical protein
MIRNKSVHRGGHYQDVHSYERLDFLTVKNDEVETLSLCVICVEKNLLGIDVLELPSFQPFQDCYQQYFQERYYA